MVEREEVLVDELLPEDGLVVVEVAHGAFLQVLVHDPVRVHQVVALDLRLVLDTAANERNRESWCRVLCPEGKLQLGVCGTHHHVLSFLWLGIFQFFHGFKCWCG